MSQVPIVVIACLIFSLVECLLILPAHLSRQRRKEASPSTLQTAVQNKFDYLLHHFYQPLLKTTLRWRLASVIGFSSLLVISLSLIFSEKVPVAFLTDIESEVLTVHIRYQEGSPESKLIKTTRKIEDAAIRLQKELLKEFQSPQILHIRSLIDNNGISSNIYINVTGGEARKVSGKNLLQRLESKAGGFPQAEKIIYKSDFTVDQRSDYEIKLQSRSSENLYQATEQLREYIASISGTHNTFDSYSINRQRIEVNLKPLAYDLGLAQSDISHHIQQAFVGLTLDGIQRGAYDADIVLRLPEQERNSLWHLENLKIPVIDQDNQSINRVPLYQLASIDQAQASSNIQRLNGKRVSYIATNINYSQLKRSDLHQTVTQYFSEKIEPYYNDIEISKGKSNKTEAVVKERLIYGFIGAVVFMFLTMAVLFGSYAQPLMILTAVPFGIIGAIAGHWIMGYSLTVWSLAGVIAVSGIVVNDNIVLIHFINETIKKGSSVHKAILKAGKARFRPIILTTLTTFFGLIPIMFEKSFEAQFLIPMAISISFGVLFATTISLLLVPAMYL